MAWIIIPADKIDELNSASDVALASGSTGTLYPALMENGDGFLNSDTRQEDFPSIYSACPWLAECQIVSELPSPIAGEE